MPRALAALFAAVLIVSGAAGARAADLDDAAKAAAVAKAADLLRGSYAFPELGAKVADKLTASLAAGTYRAAATPDAFADALNRDIRSVTSDPHLKVFTKQPVDDPAPPSEAGFLRVDMLQDDIGYVELVGFPPLSLFKAEADKVMKLMQGSRALIIDLRRNRGGAPQAVAYMDSFFFSPSSPVHVNDLIMRTPGSTETKTYPMQTSPTPTSYLNRPVILITGSKTISGGEELAYDLQAQKRATLIGSATAGGANPGATLPLIPGLSVFLPTGRAENPVTRTNWEGAGVQPDTLVEPSDVMDAAVAAADRALGLPTASQVADPQDSTDEAPWVKAELMRPFNGPHPGTQQALRHALESVFKDRPDYGAMTPEVAEQTRAQIANLQSVLKNVGAPSNSRFVENDQIGDDVYEVYFAHGTARWIISLDASGKIALLQLGNDQ